MPEERARLRIGSYGERSVNDVTSFAKAVEDSHDGLLAFLNLFDREAQGSGSRRPSPTQLLNRLERLSRPRTRRGIGRPERSMVGVDAYQVEAPRSSARLPRPPRLRRETQMLIGRDEHLIVVEIAVASPGFWVFLGALNPLEAINRFLEGHHERRKDKNYREAADKRRLDLENERLQLENELLGNRVVRERLQLAEALGISPRDQTLLLNRLAIDPLLDLAEVADRGLAFPASAIEEEVEADEALELEQPSAVLAIEPPPLIN